MNIDEIIRQVTEKLDAGQHHAEAAEKTDSRPAQASPAPSADSGGLERIVAQVVSGLGNEKPCGTGAIGSIVARVADSLGSPSVAPAVPAAAAEPSSACAQEAPGRTGHIDAGPPSSLEHALLAPDICVGRVREACTLARKHIIAAVNVAPYYVSEAAEILRGSTVAVGSAVGIPNAAMSAAAKIADVHYCIESGATEIDVALNNLAIKSGELKEARRELEEILMVAQGKAIVKAAFEHSLFSTQEKEEVLRMLRSCGVEYVKIQNALGGLSAREEDILFAKNILGRNVKIKIDGGVKTAQRVRELLNAGADRIGTSATFKILSPS